MIVRRVFSKLTGSGRVYWLASSIHRNAQELTWEDQLKMALELQREALSASPGARMEFGWDWHPLTELEPWMPRL